MVYMKGGKRVDKINPETLRSMARTGVPVFDDKEIEFFSRYAPYAFAGKPLDEALRDIGGRYELGQQVFASVVKTDTVVQNDIALVDWLEDNVAGVNTIIDALGVGRIDWSRGEDAVRGVYALKTLGLRALELLTDHVDYTMEQRDDVARDGRYADVAALIDRLFPGCPSFIFGSYLKNGRAGDIDVRVFPEELTRELYESLHDRRHKVGGTPLDLMLTPVRYAGPFLLSDNWCSFLPARSALLRGPLWYPSPLDDSHYDHVRMTDMATQGLRIRMSLTPKGLAECKGILPRINSRIKKPRYMKANLEEMTGKIFDIPDQEKLQHLPSDEDLLEALVQANLRFNQLSSQYHSLVVF